MNWGRYEGNRRPVEPPITDARGRLIRSVGKTQAFLSPTKIEELAAAYREGLTLRELAERFQIRHRTAAAHLVRQGVPMRVQGLTDAQAPEAVRLYESGLTLMEVGLQFGVSQGAVRRVVALAGVPLRAKARRPGPLRHRR
jgi:DNA-binding CsgD family transcriptional regulator